jgi:hypothetical protein
MKQRVITIERTEQCKILVNYPDDWTDADLYEHDAEELIKGVRGLEWESGFMDDYTVDEVSEATDEMRELCSGEVTLP